jgi:hypothetical protein
MRPPADNPKKRYSHNFMDGTLYGSAWIPKRDEGRFLDEYVTDMEDKQSLCISAIRNDEDDEFRLFLDFDFVFRNSKQNFSQHQLNILFEIIQRAVKSFYPADTPHDVFTMLICTPQKWLADEQAKRRAAAQGIPPISKSYSDRQKEAQEYNVKRAPYIGTFDPKWEKTKSQQSHINLAKKFDLFLPGIISDVDEGKTKDSEAQAAAAAAVAQAAAQAALEAKKAQSTAARQVKLTKEEKERISASWEQSIVDTFDEEQTASMHIYFLGLFVNRTQAFAIMNKIRRDIKKYIGELDCLTKSLATTIDTSVLEDGHGLRMPGTFKAKKCPECPRLEKIALAKQQATIPAYIIVNQNSHNNDASQESNSSLKGALKAKPKLLQERKKPYVDCPVCDNRRHINVGRIYGIKQVYRSATVPDWISFKTALELNVGSLIRFTYIRTVGQQTITPGFTLPPKFSSMYTLVPDKKTKLQLYQIANGKIPNAKTYSDEQIPEQSEIYSRIAAIVKEFHHGIYAQSEIRRVRRSQTYKNYLVELDGDDAGRCLNLDPKTHRNKESGQPSGGYHKQSSYLLIKDDGVQQRCRCSHEDTDGRIKHGPQGDVVWCKNFASPLEPYSDTYRVMIFPDGNRIKRQYQQSQVEYGRELLRDISASTDQETKRQQLQQQLERGDFNAHRHNHFSHQTSSSSSTVNDDYDHDDDHHDNDDDGHLSDVGQEQHQDEEAEKYNEECCGITVKKEVQSNPVDIKNQFISTSEVPPITSSNSTIKTEVANLPCRKSAPAPALPTAAATAVVVPKGKDQDEVKIQYRKIPLEKKPLKKQRPGKSIDQRLRRVGPTSGLRYDSNDNSNQSLNLPVDEIIGYYWKLAYGDPEYRRGGGSGRKQRGRGGGSRKPRHNSDDDDDDNEIDSTNNPPPTVDRINNSENSSGKGQGKRRKAPTLTRQQKNLALY